MAAHLRIPLLKPHTNCCATIINPFLINSSCSLDEPTQQVKTTTNEITPTYPKYRDYKHLIKQTDYRQCIRYHLTRGTISLIDIPNSKTDFDIQNGVIHVLQLDNQQEIREQMFDLSTIGSVQVDFETTSIASHKQSQDSELEGYILVNEVVNESQLSINSKIKELGQ